MRGRILFVLSCTDPCAATRRRLGLALEDQDGKRHKPEGFIAELRQVEKMTGRGAGHRGCDPLDPGLSRSWRSKAAGSSTR